jgi:acetylornithine/N-succinyldiaminopimelate aminotransferase
MIASHKLLPVHKRFDLNFTKGQGVYLFNEKNEKYLDFSSGIAVNCLGHCHPKMVEAITLQANKLWHISNIFASNELNDYAEKIINSSRIFDHVFFCNSGAEAIECAIKMIRRYFYIKQQNKYRIITFKGAFHGRTIATISAASKKKYLEGFEPALQGFDNVEFGDIDAVKKAITSETAGILIEPIQGEEGIRVSDKEFILQLRKLCDEHKILLAFDEVQCGNGRTGYLFAYDYYQVKPDIISTAKGIGGGFPLGACLANKEASLGMTYGVHGTTYGGNPLAMSVANAVIDVILGDGFLDQVKINGHFFKDELLKLQSKFSGIISEVRGVGFMIGIKINEKFEHALIVQKFIDNKLLSVPASDNVIRLLPPLICIKEHIIEAIQKIDLSLQQFQDQNIQK